MNVGWVVAAALVVGGGPKTENPLVTQLVEQGAPLADGQRAKFPPPTMPPGLDAAGQRAVIKQVAEPRYSVDEFLRESAVAPSAIKVSGAGPQGDASSAHQIDFYFVGYGHWDTVTSPAFLESLVQPGQKSGNDAAGALAAAGYLSAADLARRGIETPTTPGVERRHFYTSINLLERVLLQTTRQSVLTRTADSALLAVDVDPRFDHDAEHPNQWRFINRDADNKPVLGPPQPYRTLAFYVQATRLHEPAGAIFIEAHTVFDEPKAWMGGFNFLRSKLPLVFQDQIRGFRRKLIASAGAAQ